MRSADLHLRYEVTRQALQALRPHPEDWLILAGDVGETEQHLRFALAVLTRRFARLLWVPGNHDLWTVPPPPGRAARARRSTSGWSRSAGTTACSPRRTRTSVWPGEGGPARSSRRSSCSTTTPSGRTTIAGRGGRRAGRPRRTSSARTRCSSTPTPTRRARPGAPRAAPPTEPRLAEAARAAPLVLINHFPLRQDLAVLPRIPRFSIWCGTRRTEDWHLRFRAEAVVYGHLHIRATHWRDGVRFEEVSLGYPQNWDERPGRSSPTCAQILPQTRAAGGNAGSRPADSQGVAGPIGSAAER